MEMDINCSYYTVSQKTALRNLVVTSGVTTAPADPAMQGGPRTQGAQSGCPKIFSDSALYCSVRHCSFKCFMTRHRSFGSDPGPFTPNVLDFLTFWIDTLIFRNVL